MTRRLRSLDTADLPRLPGGCGSCVFWESAGERERACGSVRDAELAQAWHRRVTDEWGACGRVAYEDTEVLGFIKYGPSGFFPQAAAFRSTPKDPDVPLIACMHVAPEARQHGLGTVLLRAALRDLAVRGERRVECIGSAHKPESLDGFPFLRVDFLFRNGFTIVTPDPQFPLLKLDLRSLAMITENLEAAFESLRFPQRVPKRAPATWMKGQ